MSGLPKWKCHKVVEAAKIVAIKPIDNSDAEWMLFLLLPDGTELARLVSASYVNKHDPTVGGYFVVYSDGYESWSPAEAFLQGYSLLSDSETPV